jgi:SAM-dependent methyltransferase
MRIDRLETLAAFALALVAGRADVVADWRRGLKRALGPRYSTLLRCIVRRRGLPRWGNLRRREPFSAKWGIDRGTPVDRYFGDRFFAENRHLIVGRVLEVQTSIYTARYGSAVTRADSVDIDGQCQPTFVCDLARADDVIASNAYDCFLLPYTLPFIKDLQAALRNVLRVVKPGGVVLATTTVVAPELADYPEYWRITEQGWRETLAAEWPGCEIEVRTHGNCVSAIAAILGLAQEELTTQELNRNDPRFPVLISIKARKPLDA